MDNKPSEINSQQNYRTADIYIGAILTASKVRLIEIEESSSRSLVFIFEDEQNCRQILDKFFLNDLPIDAKTLIDAIKNMKDIIFSKLRERNLQKIHTE